MDGGWGMEVGDTAFKGIWWGQDRAEGRMVNELW